MEVAPDANPPVCKIMDYNRFKYETAQKAKESKKKGTNSSIKEMKYRPKIGTGDFATKTRQVQGFLDEGHKVKVTIMFRGREVSHPELGMKLLEDLAERVSAVAKVEASPKLDGRNMTMVLAPDRRARQPVRKPGSPEPTEPREDQAQDGSVPAPSADTPVPAAAATPAPSADTPTPSADTPTPSADTPAPPAPAKAVPASKLPAAPRRADARDPEEHDDAPPAPAKAAPARVGTTTA